MDEKFVGGKLSNMQTKKAVLFRRRTGRTRPRTGKKAIGGLLDRDLRQVRAKVMPNMNRNTLQNEILKDVKYGSNVYTDNCIAYDNCTIISCMTWYNNRRTTCKGRVHTNGPRKFLEPNEARAEGNLRLRRAIPP